MNKLWDLDPNVIWWRWALETPCFARRFWILVICCVEDFSWFLSLVICCVEDFSWDSYSSVWSKVLRSCGSNAWDHDLQ